MASRYEGLARSPAPAPAYGRIKRALRSMLGRVAEWRERSETRTHLAAMNERMLKDIGISRADAARESRKPFWQA